MTRKLKNYLRMHRKRCGLSQGELAFLLGCRSGAKVSRYERHDRQPGLNSVLAFEAIYGTPARDLFRGIFLDIKQQILRRAPLLSRKLNEAKYTTARKRQALKSITARLANDDDSPKTNGH